MCTRQRIVAGKPSYHSGQSLVRHASLPAPCVSARDAAPQITFFLRSPATSRDCCVVMGADRKKPATTFPRSILSLTKVMNLGYDISMCSNQSTITIKGQFGRIALQGKTSTDSLMAIYLEPKGMLEHQEKAFAVKMRNLKSAITVLGT